MTIESDTPAYDKGCWQAPFWFFDILGIKPGFWLDSTAGGKSVLCAHWLTEVNDVPNSGWVSYGAIWNNPSHGSTRPWVEKAAEQCI